jgi:hypothetical protein
LRGKAIERHDGCVAMKIKPEAGALIGSMPRTAPIHQHVNEQGFLDYVNGSVGFTYHDENGNGRLDFDPTGAPNEGYGVSNGARNPQAPPEFAKAAFEAGDQNKPVTIEIVYSSEPQRAGCESRHAEGCKRSAARETSPSSRPEMN